jgi:site-specific DNA-methyltransferase (adenine-specific)
VETVAIESLTFDPANVRKHDEKNLAAIKASLNRFGQQKPIVVDASGVVRAGNGTLAAAKALGWKEIRIVRSSLAGSEATAYAIADNRTAELAEWDEDALSQTLAALQIEDENLAVVTGFDAKEIDALLAPDEVTEDEFPEQTVDPITKTGDLWLLGEHRLLCGDSTKADEVKRLMDGMLASLVVTDPPYGVSYAEKNAFLNAFDEGNRVQTPIQNDHLDKESVQKLWNDSFTQMGASMRPGACVYCFMPQGGDQMMMMMMMTGAGIEPRHELIWLKNNHVLGRTDYAYKHEPIMYAWKSGGHRFYGDFQTSVLEFDRPNSSKLHPTMKPVELIARLVQNSSVVGDVLYDPFLGSGTTLIAAEQLGRKCYGMEISPAYCDVIVKRWENLTGKKAVRE